MRTGLDRKQKLCPHCLFSFTTKVKGLQGLLLKQASVHAGPDCPGAYTGWVDAMAQSGRFSCLQVFSVSLASCQATQIHKGASIEQSGSAGTKQQGGAGLAGG